mgnify:CR=1 FL=1
MGYNLRIGEAVICYSDESARVDCETVRRDDSPSFGDPTDGTNCRWPSYTVWADMMAKLGLTDVMFNRRNGGVGEFEYKGKWLYPLIPEHPGAAPITREHVEYVEEKLAAYKAAHPDHRAAYPPPKPDAEPIAPGFYREDDLVADPRYDGALCRGEWLAWWMRWAVENCKQPVFVNS